MSTSSNMVHVSVNQSSQEVVLDTPNFIPASQPSELLFRTRTNNFINKTRFISANNGSSIDQIYYRMASLQLLDPEFTNLTSSLKSYWLDQILTFYNLDGGFGNWQYDRSGLSSTNKALHILNWTNSMSLINTTQTQLYLDNLRNTLTNGYTSYTFDSDSDVYSTYLAVESYDLLGLSPINITDVRDVFVRAQNNNSVLVPVNELGGFGKQSNNLKDIYWTSEATITRAALEGLTLTGGINLINATSGSSFISSLQTNSGGFTNDLLVTSTKVTASYTSAAIDAIKLLNGNVNESLAISYLMSLENTDGGFKLSDTSVSASLTGTYFALNAIDQLNGAPSNITRTLEYILSPVLFTDGFGANPGSNPSLRETFDAVYALNLTNRYPHNPTGITDFVESYYNLDGGYGLTGSFTESTFRAVSTYSLLGIPFPNSVESINFIQGLQRPDGGFSKGSSLTTSYVISTYRAIMTLDLLGAEPVDKGAAINYLKARQNGDGGFGGFNGDISDVSSTYRAIRGVIVLGGIINDPIAAITFLQASQNPNGGFKRSPSDLVGPNNFSSSVYSYSAYRSLKLLGSLPANISGLWLFLKEIRNLDGGFGIRDRYASDIAYTFTSLWILKFYHKESGFGFDIQADLSESRSDYSSISLTVIGGVSNYIISTEITNGSGVVYSNTTLLTQAALVAQNISSLVSGNYSMNIMVSDGTGAISMYTSNLYIGNVIQNTQTTPLTSESTTSAPDSSSQVSISTSSTSQTNSPIDSNQLPSFSDTDPGIVPENISNLLPFLIFGSLLLVIGMIYVVKRRG